MKISDYKNNLNDFLKSYSYQPFLTKKLDSLYNVTFTQFIINEIVLWKVDRYAALNSDILLAIEDLKVLTTGMHRQAETTLESLLNTRGVDLPMASAFLRFRNPKAFQIIDRRAYRAIYGRDYPLHTKSPIQRKISTYFEYLDKLIELCKKRNLDFQIIDRLLYEFDKRINRNLKKKMRP